MGKLMIVNGSPRAPKSNSKQYIALFRAFWQEPAAEYNVTLKEHVQICEDLDQYSDLLFVFPLYADGIPVTLMGFLETLAECPLQKKPAVHVMINCGFLEPEQNLVAIDMLRLFCRQNHFPLGAVLCIGSGEAILKTPFVFLVKRKIRKLSRAIQKGIYGLWKVTMPLPKNTFLKASTKYWIKLGAENGISPEQMANMEIEDSHFS